MAASEQARPVVTLLAVAPLLVTGDDGLGRLARSLQVEIAERDLLRQEAEVHSRMQRLDAAGDAMGSLAALRRGRGDRAPADRAARAAGLRPWPGRSQDDAARAASASALELERGERVLAAAPLVD